MSIRFRLTLLYSLIVALTLIVFSVTLYITLSRITLNFLHNTLENEAQRLIQSQWFRLDHIDYPASQFAAPETYVQTRRCDGQIIDRSANLKNWTLPLSEEGLLVCKTGQAWTEVTPTKYGGLFTFNKPIQKDGRVVGIVQLARSLADYTQSLNTLRTILIVGSSVVTIVAFGVGWVLAGMALRPIHRITQTAQAIGAERDFNRRVDHAGPNDEIGQLATTFNAMLTELGAAYQQVEGTLRAQRRFVADASHELRTPLTTIRGNLDLLQRDPPISPEDRVAVLTDMVDECERLIRLVNNLLMLARADAGRPLRQQPLAINPLLEEVCRQHRCLAPDKTITVQNVPGLMVVGDPDALKQVCLALLDNALKFTPTGGEVVISTEVVREGVAIHFQDQGPGIAPEVLPHIFERFYQGDSARSGAGFGLGLAIAKALVEAQGGAIHVESVVGQGSRFTVILPRHEPVHSPIS